MWKLLVAALLAFACTSAPPATPPPAPLPTVPSPDAPPAAPDAREVTAPPAADAGGATTTAIDAGAPLPVTRTGKTWPFHAWSRAEAVTFNGENLDLVQPEAHAVTERGFAMSLASRKALDMRQAEAAVAAFRKVGDTFFGAKCFTPRHAVILYDGDTPVASIDVCFECDGISTWPEAVDLESMSEAERAAHVAREAKGLAKVERTWKAVRPKLEALFREVGFEVKPPTR